MATADNHADRYLRGLDLDYFGSKEELARAAFTAGFSAALKDRDAIAKSLGDKLDHMRPGLRQQAEALARGNLRK